MGQWQVLNRVKSTGELAGEHLCLMTPFKRNIIVVIGGRLPFLLA